MWTSRCKNATSFVFGIIVASGLCLIMYITISPQQAPLDLQGPFPTLDDGKVIYNVDLNIQSRNTDIFVGDTLAFAIRLTDLKDSYYLANLKDRDIGVFVEGVAPYDNADVVPLSYIPERNEYVGHKKVSYFLPGDYSLRLVYSYSDRVSPRRTLATWSMKIHVLPYYEKSVMRLNATIYILTKIMVVLTVVLVVLTAVLAIPIIGEIRRASLRFFRRSRQNLTDP
jgi:hypothetical protein